MKKIVTVILVFTTFIGCQKKEANTSKSEENKAETSKPLEKNCYAYEGNGSKIILQITDIDNGINGYLKYNLAEKDQNKGTFKGIQKGDTLFATYTFKSEGVESKRDIAFLLKNNQLVEGYGELATEGMTTKFKNPSQLKFDSTMPLSKIDCKGTSDCLIDFGFMPSEIKNNCIELSTIPTRLNPLKDGAMSTGESAYVLFSTDQSKAELFLPNQEKGIVLNKKAEGNWDNAEYKLIAWKGYVIQQNGKPIFGG